MMISMVRRSAVTWGFAMAAVACAPKVSDLGSDDTGTTSSTSTDAGSSSTDAPPSTDCMGEHNAIIDGECYCEDPYQWCEPDDPNDYSCCGSSDPNPSAPNPSTDADTSTTDVDPTGVDTTAGDTGPTQPDPADCTEDTRNLLFCTNTAAMGPQDSAYFVCTGGEWVEMPDAADELCQFDGYDFAYGCIDDGQAIAFICGNGSGAPCDDASDAMCIDAVEIDTCLFGRSTQDSCATICNTIGDENGVTYDTGFCDTQAKQAECVCCDAGECP